MPSNKFLYIRPKPKGFHLRQGFGGPVGYTEKPVAERLRVWPFRTSIRALALALFTSACLHGQPTASVVYPGPDGRLVYEGYANQGQTSTGNQMIDFSHAGYQGGGVAIPWVPVEVTLDPLPGDDDDYARIQAAIDEVSVLPLSAAGFRGAVLLRAGTYHVSESLRVDADGVVIRGEGQDAAGTIIQFTATVQDDLFEFFGSSGWSRISGTTSAISDSVVPSGVRTFNVNSAAGFSVGDRLIVQRTPNQTWIDLLGMGQYGWTPGAYNSESPRVITAIDGNTITVDAPLVHAIESQYGGGEVYRYHFNGALQQVGIENIRLQSSFTSNTDEDHGWSAVVFEQVENGWARRVTARHFGFAAIDIQADSQFITIEDCANLDPTSEITGARRYSFNINNASFVLMQRCYSIAGRHDYVTGSKTAGPNVFVDSLAENPSNDIGPHQRYAEGLLFDNIKGGAMNVQNRRDSGSGHGWAGAQTVFWNAHATTMIVDAPKAAMNFSIGSIANQQQTWWPPNEPDGIWESRGVPVTPRSLYYTQLQDRLGAAAVADVTTPKQLQGTIWGDLAAWSGDAAPPALPDLSPLHVDAGRDVSIKDDSLSLLAVIRHPLPDNFPQSQAWSQVNGPADVVFGDAANRLTEVTFPLPGVYELQFAAAQTDDRDPQDPIAYSDADTLVVTVTEPPVASPNPTTVDTIIGRRESNAPALGYYPDSGNDIVGGYGSTLSAERIDTDIVLGFPLPALPDGRPLAGATLHFEITAKRNFSGADPGLDVYLLDTASPGQTGTGFFYRGADDPNPAAVPIGRAHISVAEGPEVVFDPGTQRQSFTVEGAALERLQSFYGEDGVPTQAKVFFRLNLDFLDSNPTIQLDRYKIDPSLSASSLDVYAEPSYSFADWIHLFNFDPSLDGPDDDPDGDGIANALENFFGTPPDQTSSEGLRSRNASTVTFFQNFNTMVPQAEPTGADTVLSGVNSEVEVVAGNSGNPIESSNGLHLNNDNNTRAPIIEWDLARPVSAAVFRFDYHLTQTGSEDSGNGNVIYFSVGRQAGDAINLNSSSNRLLNTTFSDDGTIDYIAGGSNNRLLGQPLALDQNGHLTVFANDFDNRTISFFNPQTNAPDTLAPNRVVFFLNDTEVFRSDLADKDLGGGLVSTSEDNIGRIGFAGLSGQSGVRIFVDNLSVRQIPSFTFTHPQNAQPAGDLKPTYRWSTDLSAFHGDGETDANGTTVTFAPSTEDGETTVDATTFGTPTDQLFIRLEVTNE